MNIHVSVDRLIQFPATLFVLVIAVTPFTSCQTTPESTDNASAVEVADSELTIRRRPCASSAQCGPGQYCTTEDGVCNPPPGCRPGAICPAVCYGVCAPRPVACGPTVCPAGQVCCNASCGICTPPGGVCTQQVCEPPAGRCRTDADCRTFSDYCTGCDCRALSVCQKDPVCPGPGVQCFVDPCLNKQAVCRQGACQLRDQPAACPDEKCGPALGLPNHQCPDGSVAGPTGRCLQQPDGSCGWEIAACPDPSICSTTAAD